MKIQYCKNCVMPSTRPRLTFNNKGVCSACEWSEEKKTLDWKKRRDELLQLCEKHKKLNRGRFDCIIPVSGGKDSCYVSYKMKHELGMQPLCLTINPPLAKDVGEENLRRFAEAGYDLMALTPDPKLARKINKIGFFEYGLPLYSWMINLHTAIHQVAIRMNIPFIMYGEEGETEYGGTQQIKHNPFFDREYSRKIYLSSRNPEKLLEFFSEKELSWWMYPSEEEYQKAGLEIAHWSYFENWDSYRNYLVAKEKFGMKEQKERCQGTYNNFAQTDTILYDLHTYLMFLKYGFGRCSQDVGIDIRRGALTRDQGMILVKQYDSEINEEYIPQYLDYYEMSRAEFDAVIDKWANKDVLHKVDNKWKLIKPAE